MLGTEDIASRHSLCSHRAFFCIKTENEESDDNKLLKVQKWHLMRKRNDCIGKMSGDGMASLGAVWVS